MWVIRSKEALKDVIVDTLEISPVTGDKVPTYSGGKCGSGEGRVLCVRACLCVYVCGKGGVGDDI